MSQTSIVDIIDNQMKEIFRENKKDREIIHIGFN